MAKNVNVLCWALFQDALLELSTCGKWLRACLHGGGGPQIDVVTCGGSPHLSCNRNRIKMRYYMDRRVTSPTWGLPPPLVARKNADSLNTMILDFLVDFKTGESRVFWKLQFPAHWLNIIFYAALYRTLRTLLTKCVVKSSRSSWGLNLWELNPLNPTIKIQILICYPYAFSIERVGEFVKVSIGFILCDHILSSHDHSLL